MLDLIWLSKNTSCRPPQSMDSGVRAGRRGTAAADTESDGLCRGAGAWAIAHARIAGNVGD